MPVRQPSDADVPFWRNSGDLCFGVVGSPVAQEISDGRTGVRLTDPEALLSTVVLQGAPDLASVARDARERMLRVADSLSRV